MDLRQFRGPNADPNQPNKIGANAIRRARAAGLSDAQIQSAMRSSGVTTSAVANQELGTSFSQPMNLRSFRGPQADPNQPNKIGANAIARARAAGYSDQQIESAMQYQGVTTSRIANDQLGTAFSTGAPGGGAQAGVQGRYFDPTDFSEDPNDFMGEGKFGAGALDKARKAGFSDAQIRSTLAGAGVEIGQAAADLLGVMPGKTFYTGPQGKLRPDGVERSYTGQAGERESRPVLLPKGAYDYAQNKGFESNYVFAAGGKNDADIANLFLRENPKQGGQYGTYSEPDWEKYVGENGYWSARPDLTGHMGSDGIAKPSPELAPKEDAMAQYKANFREAVDRGNQAVGGAEMPVPQTKAAAEDPTSEAPAPGDVDNKPVTQMKVDAEDGNYVAGQLDRNVGYLTSGARNYYASRFA